MKPKLIVFLCLFVFEKMNELTSLSRTKKKNTEIKKIRNETGDIPTNVTEMKEKYNMGLL